MKAIVITRPGGPEVLEVQERSKPEPGLGQISVRVRASALNRADILQRQGNCPVPAGSPADISGMEYAGEVDALGPGATLWKVCSMVGASRAFRIARQWPHLASTASTAAGLKSVRPLAFAATSPSDQVGLAARMADAASS